MLTHRLPNGSLHLVQDLDLLVHAIQVRNVSCVKKHVDILHHALIYNLSNIAMQIINLN